VVAWDLCDRNNDTGAEALGRAAAAAAPAKPLGLRASRSSGVEWVTWDPVAVDLAGNEIFVDDYEVERCDAGGSCSLFQSATPSAYFEDVVPGASPVYRVRARNACASNNVSEWSDASSLSCAFSGHVEIVHPLSGWIAGGTTVRVRVVGGTETYTAASLILRRVSDGATQTVPLAGPGPDWTYAWTPPGNGGYVLRGLVTNSTGCAAAAAARVFVGN
jgi:hypothetical protein